MNVMRAILKISMQDPLPRTYSFSDEFKDEEAPPDEDIKVGLTRGKPYLPH
jgi:hypothetical protein